MIEAAVAIQWPDSIPTPILDFTGAPQHAILASPANNARIQRRLRFSGTPASISVSWALTIGQYLDFKDFFISELETGANLFSIDLRYPKNSAVTTWVVRFSGGYSASYDEHNWIIQSSLFLVRPLLVAAAAAGGFAGFLVEPDSNPFIVLPDYPFYVRAPRLSDYTGFLTVDGEPFIDTGGHALEVLDL